MRRIIVDYAKLTNDILSMLVEKFPDGYEDSDIIRFRNAQNELIEAVEVRTEDTIYLVKVSKKLATRIENFEEDEDLDVEVETISPVKGLDLDDDINNITFDFNKGDINVNGVWDVKTFNSISNPKTEDINNTINFVVKYKQQKIGDLKFKDLGNQRELFIFYKDQSSENTALYYDVFFSDFKSIFQQYFDVDDLDLDI